MRSRVAIGVVVFGALAISGGAREQRAPRLSAGGLVAQFERGHVRFDTGRRELELSLAAFGRAGALSDVAPPSVEYARDGVHLRRAEIDEWYRTDAHGVEQGFTLASAPSGEGDVVLDIDTRSKVRARGDGLRIDVGGQDVGIHGLSVVDADGRALVAKMEPSGSRDTGFVISFDDRDAKYPVVVDPYYLVESPIALSGMGALDAGCTYGPLATGLIGNNVYLGVTCASSTHSAVYMFARSGGGTGPFVEFTRFEPPAPDNVAGSRFGSVIDAGEVDSGFLVGAPGVNAAFLLTWGSSSINVLKKFSATGGDSNYGLAVSYHNSSGLYSDVVIYNNIPGNKLSFFHYAGSTWNAAGELAVGKSGSYVQPGFRVRNGRVVAVTSLAGSAKIDTFKWDSASSTFVVDATLGSAPAPSSPVVAYADTFLVGPQVWTYAAGAWGLQATLAATPNAWGIYKDTVTALTGTTLDVFQRTGTTWSPKTSYAVATGTTALVPYSATGFTELGGTTVREGVLTPTKANGSACAATKECTSGICVDGVCCDVACTGICVACTAAKKGSGVDGTCGPAPTASVGRGGCPKGPDTMCGPDGLCDGAGACRGPVAKGVSCGASTCTAGTVTGKTCDGAGACGTAPADCAPFVCKDGTSCFGACTDDSACLAPNVCVMGTCGPKLVNGKPTTDPKVCVSGFAADGVCCDKECTGTCTACVASKTGGADGTCALVAKGTDPDGECKASCAGSSVVSAGSCDGAGACTMGSKSACAPYGCEAGACKTKCIDDSDCSGAICDAGICKPKTSSGPVTSGFTKCSAASECASGFCVEGVCCDSACDTPCHSCALPTSPGKCSLAPSGTDPRKQCSGDQSCHQTCDGTGACVAVRTGDQCAPSKCTDGSHGVGAAVCPALDAACPTAAAVPFDCGPYACSDALGACFTQCVASTDCSSGFACDTASARCVAAPPEEDSGGCAFSPRGRLSLFGGALALAFVGILRRRRVTRRDDRGS